MKALAYAKVNLGLRVMARNEEGLHPLRGLFQTVDWSDAVTLEDAEEDRIDVPGGGAPEDETNIAWRAVAAARRIGTRPAPVRLVVEKHIPSPAGLGGGSADAAAALNLASRRFSVSYDDVKRLAVDLGSDVPFAVVGGTAVVSGRGESVASRPDAMGFALAVVVPPLDLPTAAVYAAWDALDGPGGPEIVAADLPPSLRDYAPLANDLYPAAVHVDGGIDEWRAELVYRWGVPVVMTGSGAALFAYFPTRGEAEEAAGAAPRAARAARAVEPVAKGWEVCTP